MNSDRDYAVHLPAGTPELTGQRIVGNRPEERRRQPRRRPNTPRRQPPPPRRGAEDAPAAEEAAPAAPGDDRPRNGKLVDYLA